jgi:hypothetical protein
MTLKALYKIACPGQKTQIFPLSGPRSSPFAVLALFFCRFAVPAYFEKKTANSLFFFVIYRTVE